jgi:hypothetical protein
MRVVHSQFCRRDAKPMAPMRVYSEFKEDAGEDAESGRRPVGKHGRSIGGTGVVLQTCCRLIRARYRPDTGAFVLGIGRTSSSAV